ncbi:nuclear transport factor 2 family protein [Terrarubrum flagellatum]|uniref:nuclear transport factor 2 family protein n=1 Tax=Terrirubrum flagellatum TaxID=2895980 RepID=UPI00314518A7
MTNRAAFQSIVDQAYAARVAGDVDALMACFAPDATFRLAGSPESSPGAMKATGAAEIRPMMEQLCQAWEFIGREQLSFVTDGDNVAVHSAIEAKFLPSNEIVETEFHDLWTIRDGKIASLIQFVDTAMINAVIGRAQLNGFLPKTP